MYDDKQEETNIFILLRVLYLIVDEYLNLRSGKEIQKGKLK